MKTILISVSATLAVIAIILTGLLATQNAEAKKTIFSATTTEQTINTVVVDLPGISAHAPGGVCYRLRDNDGDGFTFLIANNGNITGSLTCD